MQCVMMRFWQLKKHNFDGLTNGQLLKNSHRTVKILKKQICK